MLARISALPTPVKLVREEEDDFSTMAPAWYMLDTGLLLRHLTEVEADARKAHLDEANTDKCIHEWITELAMELACQVDNPTTSAAQEIIEATRRRMRRYSHAGNASGKRGRPKTKKEDTK